MGLVMLAQIDHGVIERLILQYGHGDEQAALVRNVIVGGRAHEE
jgi:hypothetical protein